MSELTVKVRGLVELRRALAAVDRDLDRGIRRRLAAIAQPVAAEATSLAEQQIRRIGPRWSKIKPGVTRKAIYIAPAARPMGRLHRPNLGTLLVERAMLPAAEHHADRAEEEMGRLLDDIARMEGF